MRRQTAVVLLGTVILAGCGGAPYWRAGAPAGPHAFDCSVAVLDSLGYALYHKDDARREARAEVREGPGFSYVTRDIIWVRASTVGGVVDSLYVTAGFADASPASPDGGGQTAFVGRAPSDRTLAHATHVLQACGGG